MKEKNRESWKIAIHKPYGITLIALVITIIVLLILAGVSITILTGNNGIFEQAKEAKNKTEEAKKQEVRDLDYVDSYILSSINGGFNETQKVNSPKLLNGMTRIMFKDPTENEKGQIIRSGENGFSEKEWYKYDEKKWANVETQDGSMWVWIPRYAYKITYTDPNDKSKGGTIDVKFLKGTTDEYDDENGNTKIAKRVKSIDEIADTASEYYVHPAFTNESNINYANGGWDNELTGIWIAKFEAGYASGNNNAKVKESSKKYTQSTSWVTSIEAQTSDDSNQDARNWLDGIYGKTETKIKYPTFQGKTYSMNYINHSDIYDISRSLTEQGNIYGLDTNNADSHLIKNSEWGAVSYLSKSKYGLNGIEMYHNNISLENTEKSVYAVTGCMTETENGTKKITSIENINSTTGNTPNDGVYTWDQVMGKKSSSTGTIYGIYDLNGGMRERTAAYIANGNETLNIYGSSMTFDNNTMKQVSTKYVTVYPNNDEGINNLDIASKTNYELNTKIYGDAIRETSTGGTGNTSWNQNHSVYTALWHPFFIRGSSLWDNPESGIYSFRYHNGDNHYTYGFRAVLVSI